MREKCPRSRCVSVAISSPWGTSKILAALLWRAEARNRRVYDALAMKVSVLKCNMNAVYSIGCAWVA